MGDALRNRDFLHLDEITYEPDWRSYSRVKELGNVLLSIFSQFTEFGLIESERQLVTDQNRWEYFFRAYARTHRRFKNVRHAKGNDAIWYAYRVRTVALKRLFLHFKRYRGMYDSRYLDDEIYMELWTHLVFEAGQISEMLALHRQGEFTKAEHYLHYREMRALGGVRKNERSNAAKLFVISEWQSHRNSYGDNKSAFARHYVRRVKNEFAVDVTEKQLREVWLKPTPPAGTTARLPVDGE